MALLGIAIAAGAVNMNNNRRGPNCERQGCASTEDQWLSLRLTHVQLHTLALEYMAWRRQTTGVRMQYHTSERRVTVFLHYLARGGYYHQIGRAEGLGPFREAVAIPTGTIPTVTIPTVTSPTGAIPTVAIPTVTIPTTARPICVKIWLPAASPLLRRTQHLTTIIETV